jgi:hypothetical protein
VLPIPQNSQTLRKKSSWREKKEDISIAVDGAHRNSRPLNTISHEGSEKVGGHGSCSL